jgi:aquaporin TIP
VTLGFLVTGRLSPVVAVAYWIVQFVGAAAAAALLKWIFPSDLQGNLGAPAVGPGFENEAALIVEAILTFFLVWVVFATAADPRGTFKSIAGLAIGLTITLDILMAGPITGAAMNPARAFGPELLSGDWDNFWIWYIGPFAGGVLGALAYEWLYLRPLKPPVVGPPETGVVEPRPGDTALS